MTHWYIPTYLGTYMHVSVQENSTHGCNLNCYIWKYTYFSSLSFVSLCKVLISFRRSTTTTYISTRWLMWKCPLLRGKKTYLGKYYSIVNIYFIKVISTYNFLPIFHQNFVKNLHVLLHKLPVM